MHPWQYALLGGAGGVAVETLAVFSWLRSWQTARRSKHGTVLSHPPKLSRYVDMPAHACLFVLRGLLGSGTAAVFAVGHQLNGPYAAIAIGFSAPALLSRLGDVPVVEERINKGAGAAAELGQEVAN